MSKRPFSIHTFFPTGNTFGYKIAQIPTRTIQAIYIPRQELNQVIEERQELTYNGIYFLFGVRDGEEIAYIGESEHIIKRLKHHFKERKNCDYAVVFTTTSEENQLTKADIKYLENYCYQKALEANRFLIEQNTPTKSFVHEAREADLMDMYQAIYDLLHFLGFPLFLPITNEKENLIYERELFYLTNRGAEARATYSQDGMTVLKGSKVAPTETKSFQNKKLYQELQDSLIIDNDGVFIKNYTFTSPSSAAGIITRASVNGWIYWKDKKGNTLEDKIRGK